MSARPILGVGSRSADPAGAAPTFVRIKVNFLRDTAPFADLTTMTQKALMDPKRADEVFPLWVERNEVVYTNAVPMRWVGSSDSGGGVALPARRRGW